MKNLFSLFILIFTIFSSTIANPETPAFKVDVVGEGKPIIFIPGLACSGEVWTETVSKLSEQHECHVLTLAGFAGQPSLEDQSSFLPQIQKGIVTYIENKLSKKPVIIGHSLGGFLAMKIASEHPDILEKVVVVDSYPAMSKAMNPNADEAQVTMQAGMMKNMLINTPEEQFRQQQKMGMTSMMNDPKLIEQAVEWSVQTDRNAMAQAMYELLTSDIQDQLAKATCPMLVLGSWYAGKDYGLTQESVHKTYATQLAKADNCNIKIAKTARHFIMYDEFDWFVKEVNTFLAHAE